MMKLSSELLKFDIFNSSIDDLREALDSGVVSVVELTLIYMIRIARYDRANTNLNSIIMLNKDIFNQAEKLDKLLRAGKKISQLHGIPFTLKNNYKVEGENVSAGSPAFRNLVANSDASVVKFLKESGAILIGRTSMPPMAAGGLQRGLHGRAESPFNDEYLSAAWLSGSSNGSAVSTASRFATFSLGTETLSSGRSPASNNGLFAYTPSRGLISTRGLFYLLALRDVIVPYTTNMKDMLDVLNIIVHEDENTRGDFWREQPFVELPTVNEVRPKDFRELYESESSLKGKRVGVPRAFISKCNDRLRDEMSLSDDILRLWSEFEGKLAGLGAEIVYVDPPALYDYDEITTESKGMVERGLIPRLFSERIEFGQMCGSVWNDFLNENGQEGLSSMKDVNIEDIFPDELYGLEGNLNPIPRLGYDDMKKDAISGCTPIYQTEHLEQVVKNLEKFRNDYHDQWLIDNRIDFLAFPTALDVGRSDTDSNPVSSVLSWRQGVASSVGGWAVRALGIPTVNVPLGMMETKSMPVGATLMGEAYSDCKLLSYACFLERKNVVKKTPQPKRVPPLSSDAFVYFNNSSGHTGSEKMGFQVIINILDEDEEYCYFEIKVAGENRLKELHVYIDGIVLRDLPKVYGSTHKRFKVRKNKITTTTVEGPQGRIALVVAKDSEGYTVADYTVFNVPQKYK